MGIIAIHRSEEGLLADFHFSVHLKLLQCHSRCELLLIPTITSQSECWGSCLWSWATLDLVSWDLMELWVVGFCGMVWVLAMVL